MGMINERILRSFKIGTFAYCAGENMINQNGVLLRLEHRTHKRSDSLPKRCKKMGTTNAEIKMMHRVSDQPYLCISISIVGIQVRKIKKRRGRNILSRSQFFTSILVRPGTVITHNNRPGHGYGVFAVRTYQGTIISIRYIYTTLRLHRLRIDHLS